MMHCAAIKTKPFGLCLQARSLCSGITRGVGMMNIRRKLTSVTVAAAAVVMAVSMNGVTASAATKASYNTKWNSQIGWTSILGAGFLKTTDADSAYRQLRNAFMYQVISEGDILELANTEGVTIPAEALKKLASEGWISGYTYKMIAKLPLEPSDMSAVYDADYYYANNPWLQGVIDPNDKNALFQNFLAVGMQVGARGNASFDPVAYRASDKVMATAYGDNWADYYVNYLLYHGHILPYQG